jgi:hypothetical protein
MFPFFTTLIFYTSSFLEQGRARGGISNVLFPTVPNMFPTFHKLRRPVHASTKP